MCDPIPDSQTRIEHRSVLSFAIAVAASVITLTAKAAWWLLRRAVIPIAASFSRATARAARTVYRDCVRATLASPPVEQRAIAAHPHNTQTRWSDLTKENAS